MSKAKRTDPKLWDTVKDELMASSKGGKKGEWSARKAQMAVQEYKRRGGGYAADGPAQSETDLNTWTKQEWDTKSGKPSGETGERYLPKAALDALTDDEYARTSAKKRADTKRGKQVSEQPEDIAAKTAAARDDDADEAVPEPTRKELLARAKELGIEGRSRLSKAMLMDAVLAAEEIIARKEALTKRDLSEAAKVLGIEKRSAKSKDQLRDALADALGNGAVDECTKAELKAAAGYLDAAVKSSMTKSAIASAARAMVV